MLMTSRFSNMFTKASLILKMTRSGSISIEVCLAGVHRVVGTLKLIVSANASSRDAEISNLGRSKSLKPDE